MTHRRIPLVLDPPGRFTPAQITALVMAVAVAFVLVPVGARAAGQLVTLVDSTTSRQARVDGTSSLSVSTRPAASTAWAIEVTGGTGTHPLFVPPAGKTKLALSTLTVANLSPSISAFSSLYVYGSANCSSNYLEELQTLNMPVNDTITVSFPQPLVISPGGSDWCVSFYFSSGLLVATATGYYF